MKQPHINTGFTLIEVLISIVIISFILIALFNIYTGYNTVMTIQQAHIDVNGSARTIVDEFKQTAMQADSVVASHAFSGTTYSSGTSAIVFELPSIDSSGNIISGTYDYIVLYATSTSAYKITDSGTGSARISGTRHLSDTLSTLSFTYSNASITQATSTDLDVITQTTVRTQTLQAHVHETARLRNL